MVPFRKLLTVLLISLALCGVQAVQASALHDHASHVSGCALCHFDGSHAIKAPVTGHNWIHGPVAFGTTAKTQAPFTTPYPSFHGRAPPSHSLQYQQ
jgi:hypothetical protein